MLWGIIKKKPLNNETCKSRCFQVQTLWTRDGICFRLRPRTKSPIRDEDGLRQVFPPLLYRLRQSTSKRQREDKPNRTSNQTVMKKKAKTDYHHRLPRSRGGTDFFPEGNLVRVNKVRHANWHRLWADRSLEEIVDEMNELWIDPRYKLVIERR